jgi:CRP/FNR family transcriptional regulator
MLECRSLSSPSDCPTSYEDATSRLPPVPAGFEEMVRGLTLRRRILRAKQHVFRAGQKQHALYLVHSGIFKTCLVTPDGREKVTGFRLRGDLLGLDSLGTTTHACDAVSLDVGEVWELPYAELGEQLPQFQDRVTAALAGEIRRDWSWMLAVATLSAEQRVVAFLLDLAARLERLGFSPRQMQLRMTRADLGNFLSLQLETVVRALSKLQSSGLVAIDGREIRLLDPAGLQTILGAAPRLAA